MTTTNPFINNVDFNISSEQNLVEDLVVESIKFHGHTLYYLPRTLVKQDDIFGEDILSQFDSNHALEMYIENVDGFEGQGDFLSKFGLQIQDNATFTVSKRRFFEIFQSKPSRPQEGDLLYFPLTGHMLEITHTEHRNPFYQIGKNYVYRLTCQTFEYSHEQFDTGLPEADQLNDIFENDDSTENDPYADNETYQTEGDQIKDFDENDPFGSL